MDKKILAVIPARAGSKGLPKKNIKDLCGKPLISWTIEAALQSKYINRILVSTNEPEVLRIADTYNLKPPFIRPEELCNDNATSTSVITHSLKYLADVESYAPDYFILLQVTSPLRTVEHIDLAFETLFNNNWKSCISVCEAEHSPLWMNTLDSSLSMKNFLSKQWLNKPRQKLPIYYRINGAIYIHEVKQYLIKQTFLDDDTHAYIMPQEDSVDIDNEIQFLEAEILLSKKMEKDSII